VRSASALATRFILDRTVHQTPLSHRTAQTFRLTLWRAVVVIFALQIIGETAEMVASIQNPGMGEFQVRDMNDEINKRQVTRSVFVISFPTFVLLYWRLHWCLILPGSLQTREFSFFRVILDVLHVGCEKRSTGRQE
jgi:hypothetical protein